MARPKRNASQAGLDTAPPPALAAKKGRRTSNRTATETAAATRPRRSSPTDGEEIDVDAKVTPRKRGRPRKAASAPTEPAEPQKAVGHKTPKAENVANGADVPAKATRAAGAAQIPEGGGRKVGRKGKASKTILEELAAHDTAIQERRGSDVSVEIPSKKAVQAAAEPDDEDDDEGETSYWLMKAEPDTRMEKGRDVKFSIDDLKNAQEPEVWDGEFHVSTELLKDV